MENIKHYIELFETQIITIALILFISILGYLFIKIAIKKTIKKTILRNVVNKISKWLCLFVVSMLVLSVFEINIAPIIASFSILGLAISIGSQKIVEDFLSGIFIVAENHYNIGDTISVDGFKGTVIFQGLRITKVQNYKGEILTLTNRNVVNVINYSTSYATAIIDFPISYKEDYLIVKELVNNFIENYKNESIIKQPVFLGINNFNNNALEFKITCVTKPGAQFGIERDIKTKLFELFLEKKISMPSNKLNY